MVALGAPSERCLGDRIKLEIDNPPNNHQGEYIPTLIIISENAYMELCRDARFVGGLTMSDSDYIFGIEVIIGMPSSEFSVQWVCEPYNPQEQAHYIYQKDRTWDGLEIHYPKSDT